MIYHQTERETYAHSFFFTIFYLKVISKKKGIHNMYILTPYPSRPGRTEGARHGLKKVSVFRVSLYGIIKRNSSHWSSWHNSTGRWLERRNGKRTVSGCVTNLNVYVAPTIFVRVTWHLGDRHLEHYWKSIMTAKKKKERRETGIQSV